MDISSGKLKLYLNSNGNFKIPTGLKDMCEFCKLPVNFIGRSEFSSSYNKITRSYQKDLNNFKKNEINKEQFGSKWGVYSYMLPVVKEAYNSTKLLFEEHINSTAFSLDLQRRIKVQRDTLVYIYMQFEGELSYNILISCILLANMCSYYNLEDKQLQIILNNYLNHKVVDTLELCGGLLGLGSSLVKLDLGSTIDNINKIQKSVK